MTQPTFQPVNEKVLPADEMVTVRSRMPGKRGERMCSALEDQVLVHLVRDHEQVALDGELGDGGQLLAGQDGAGRVVRGVEQDQPGAGGDRGAQLVQVEAGRRPVVRAQA